MISAALLASFLESVAVMSVPHAADVVSMQRLSDHHRVQSWADANPLYGRDPDLAKMLAIKAVSAGIMSWGDHQLGKRGKGWKWAGRVAVYGAYGYIVMQNERKRSDANHRR